MEDWHLRKEVTIGNIITSMLAIAAAIGAFYNLDKRILTNTAAISENANNISEVRQDHRDDMSRILNKLDRIENILLENARRK